MTTTAGFARTVNHSPTCAAIVTRATQPGDSMPLVVPEILRQWHTRPKPRDFNADKQADYVIMSALRGPDYKLDINNSDAASDLKMITTGVIRWLVGVRSDVGAVVTSPRYAVEYAEAWSEATAIKAQLQRCSYYQPGAEHFMLHVRRAFETLMEEEETAGAPGLATAYWNWLMEWAKS